MEDLMEHHAAGKKINSPKISKTTRKVSQYFFKKLKLVIKYSI
jgi:hypothetical protein